MSGPLKILEYPSRNDAEPLGLRRMTAIWVWLSGMVHLLIVVGLGLALLAVMTDRHSASTNLVLYGVLAYLLASGGILLQMAKVLLALEPRPERMWMKAALVSLFIGLGLCGWGIVVGFVLRAHLFGSLLIVWLVFVSGLLVVPPIVLLVWMLNAARSCDQERPHS